ncbi:MAG: sugar phosphate nucleotidyltransferase [Omnitrophica WOR_2 bacterium]
MDSNLKIVIPMAGLGTRLRPHTWSKPKPLISVAGKAVLGHVLDMFAAVPDPDQVEMVFIVGYLGDQAEAYVKDNYPQIKANYVVQDEMRGQSHALYLARDYLCGPTIVAFVDTLIETDLSFLNTNRSEAVVCVKPVPDPRRFGVAEVGQDGYVKRLIEKPEDRSNNLAVVGFYYFPEAKDLLEAIEEQFNRNIQLKNEYFLADAVNIMLEKGLKMRTQAVDVWLDAGTSETLLETNRYLLDHDRDNSAEVSKREGVVVIPPVFVHPTAEVKHSIIGPYTSVGAGCHIDTSIIRDSIFEDEAQATSIIMECSLVGRKAVIRRRPGMINAGDQSEVSI